jgi:hypothetical protein
LKLGRKEKGQLSARNGNEHDGAELSTDSEGGVALAVEVPENHPGSSGRPASGSEPFGSLLVRRGLVSEDDVTQALVVQNETGKRIGETLVAMGAMNERELTLFLADLLHMPVVDLRRNNPQPDVLKLVPEQVVREHKVMPIQLDDDGLQVAVSDQLS